MGLCVGHSAEPTALADFDFLPPLADTAPNLGFWVKAVSHDVGALRSRIGIL